MSFYRETMLVTNTSSIELILESLAKEGMNVLLVGEDCQLDIAELIRLCNEREIDICGGIFPAVLYDDRYYKDALIIRRLKHVSGTCLIREDQVSHEHLPDKTESMVSALVFADGLSATTPRVLETLYQKYWDSMGITGAGCGFSTFKQKPCVFNKDGLYQDAALIVYLNMGVQVGVKHGWKRIAGPCQVSDIDGNTITELNWKPSFAVYKGAVDQHSPTPITQENFFEVAKGYPIGISREGTEDLVRDVVSSESGESITCLGMVPQHAMIHLMSATTDDLIESAAEAAREACDSIRAEDIFVTECMSRSLFMGDDFKHELTAIQKIIKEKNPQLTTKGVLSLGEISSYGDGYLEVFNKTVVVSAFY